MRTKGGGSTVRVPFLGGMSTENKGKRGGQGYMIYWTREAAARRQLIKMCAHIRVLPSHMPCLSRIAARSGRPEDGDHHRPIHKDFLFGCVGA